MARYYHNGGQGEMGENLRRIRNGDLEGNLRGRLIQSPLDATMPSGHVACSPGLNLLGEECTGLAKQPVTEAFPPI